MAIGDDNVIEGIDEEIEDKGHIPRSVNFSFAAFFIATYGYWFKCRLDWARNDFIRRQSEGSFLEEIKAIEERKANRLD
ncbi:cysteine-rich PDZ-binding protein-like [Sarcoptes scabiei]|nr:cysteine-rich PDZ-binding protein-like [Sarcoptes scabiei]